MAAVIDQSGRTNYACSHMQPNPIDFLRCPACHGHLEPADTGLQCGGCKGVYAIDQGVPALLLPGHQLDPAVEAVLEAETARYPFLMTALSLLLRVWLPSERSRMVADIGIKSGDLVLDHCTGPGSNLAAIDQLIGPTGKLVAMDLSRNMTQAARRLARRRGLNVDIHQADALQLPYADNTFDAVVHFGAINQFADQRLAIAEMLRVTKPGGAIGIVDEGVAEGKANSWEARLLIWKNRLFASKPPLDKIPDSIEHEIKWVLRDIFYQIILRKPSV